jgi:Flp pilus assembly protein TadG
MWGKNMWLQRLSFRQKNDEGQSLLETAVTMPLLFAVAFNIINLSYFWFTILTLAAAPRMGVEFSAQGGAASTSPTAPSAALISSIVYDNMTNSVHAATTSNTAVRVCSKSIGVTTAGIAQCTSFGPSFSFPAVATDPEGPTFVLNRVDVEYTVTPLIPGSAFGVFLPANLQFKRQVSMRSLF